MAEPMSIGPEGPDQKTEVRGGGRGGGEPGGGGGPGGGEPMSISPDGPDQKTEVRGGGGPAGEPMSIGPEGPDQKTEVRGGGRGGGPGGPAGPADPGPRTKHPARPTPTAHSSRVAAAQWGVIGLRQLRECGVAKSTAADWANAGRLHRRYPGVYVLGHPWLPVDGELLAALLAAGPGAVLSHATAAWWYGLIDNQPDLIEISVPGRRRAPPPGLKFHHPLRVERAHHRRLPITPPIQTLLDFAAGATVDEVRRALAEGEFRNLLDPVRVRQALGRGRPGSATVRAALDRHQPELAKTRSQLERAFLALCEATGLPVPEFNVYLWGYLLDAVWREQLVVVELDGLQGHRTPAQLEKDHERDLVMRRHGFEGRRYTWQQVTKRPQQVFADLPRAVRALAARPYQR
jgi:very-short-patch-repair endonuclease